MAQRVTIRSIRQVLHPDPTLKSKDPLRYWQERLLGLLQVATVFVAPVAVIPSAYLALQAGFKIIALVDVLLYLWLVVLTFAPRLRYRTRVAHLILLTHLLGTALLILAGAHSSGQVWVLVPLVLAALFQSRRSALHHWLAMCGILILLTGSAHMGLMPSTNQVGDQPLLWVVITVNNMVVGLFFALGVSTLTEGLQGAFRKEHTITEQLSEERAKLVETSERLRHEHERGDSLQRQLHQAQKMEDIGRLAGGVAHDFNNLLTVINSYADLAIFKRSDDSDLYANLREIRNAGERASKLTRQLLAFSRKQEMAFKPLNLNSIVQDMDNMLRRLIGEDISFTTALERSLPPVLADVGQMEQVLLNLVVNAREAMPSGGELLIETLEKELSEEDADSMPGLSGGQHAVLRVRDTGSGIDSEALDQIFEPFFTTKEKGQGTGLGLATVYGIVRQSGGHITVESAPGEGTTFSILLPVTEPDAGEAVEGEESSDLYGTETVLVVEDDLAVLNTVKRVLEASGYRVLIAEDGDLALDVFRQEKDQVDALLIDLVLPGMNGKELSDRIEELKPGLSCLYMTGYTDRVIRMQELLGTQLQLIRKPFSREKLLTELRAAIDQSKPVNQG